MLLRFSAANHASIWDEQELSLIASSLDDSPLGLLDIPAIAKGKALPFAIIYGANASGKSNILGALRFLRSAVLHSHTKGDPSGGVPRDSFSLNDKKGSAAPSRYSIDFIANGERHNYGFEANDDAFVSEWLFAFPEGKRRILFERTKQQFKFGRNLRGRNQIISELTRANSLFLSAAAQNDHPYLSTIVTYFRSMRNVSALDVPGPLAALRIKDEKIDQRIVSFLTKIGTGVVDARRRPLNVPNQIKEMERELQKVVSRFSSKSLSATLTKEGPDSEIQLGHRTRSGRTVYLDLDDESDGTRRLLVVLNEAFQSLDSGTTLLLDEMNSSLHTQVGELILGLFLSKETNKKGAQLIATTHDTNILQCDLLRRDQIWFTEKNAFGETALFPLTDIRTRKGDNIEKGYLQGRYGAIPFSGNLRKAQLGGQ